MTNQSEKPVQLTLEQIVKEVAYVAPLKTLQRIEGRIDEIVFEVDIDGVDYYLVRRQTSQSKISLSSRELEITKLIAQGLSNKCIGKTLNISPWTVATYLRRLFFKLGVTSRAAMVARVLAENLLQE